MRYSDVPALQPENVPAGSSIRVVQGSVSSIDPEAKVATVTSTASDAGEKSTYPYDFFVAATGLRRVWPVVPQSTSRKAYLAEAAAHIDAVSRGRHGVVVVGGGAVGIEMAAELKLVMPHVDVTLAHSRNKLLSSEGLSDECKDKALELLREGGVTCLMEHRLASDNVVTEEDGQVRHDIEFTNGHKMSAGVVIMAISRSVPTTTYLPEAARDHEGFIPVSNEYVLSTCACNPITGET